MLLIFQGSLVAKLISGNFYTLPRPIRFVNNFFSIFSIFFSAGAVFATSK